MHLFRWDHQNRGGRPVITFYAKPFPQLSKATSKSALTMTDVKIAHTAGQMEALKKKELVLVARAMSEEEFNQLVLAPNQESLTCVSNCERDITNLF